MNPVTVGISFVSLLVLICLWDAWLAVDDTKDNTISTVLRGWFLSYVWLYYLTALSLGVLIGHWGPV